MAALPAFAQRRISFAKAAVNFGELADRLGKLAAVRAELAAYEQKIKDVLIELDEDAVEGDMFRATVSEFSQTRLNTEAIRADMDEKWLDKYSTTSKVTQVRVKARTGALANAA